jgi:hypothetical protein
MSLTVFPGSSAFRLPVGDKKYLQITTYLRPAVEEVSPVVAEHHLIFDRSGSMWGDPIDKLKVCAEQALAVESFINKGVRTSLTSFSTHGDCTEHWTDVAAGDVFKLENPYLTMLRDIRATSLTGMTQALFSALARVKPGRTTAITLFTDGYANSPSAYAENQKLDEFIAAAKKIPGLFLNCIGYGSWCDWPRLQSMANALSGKCVQAHSFEDVLAAMKDTQAVLANGVQPALTVSPEPAAAGVEQTCVVVNRTTRKINAIRGTEDLVVSDIAKDDRIAIFQARLVEGGKGKVYNRVNYPGYYYPAMILAALSTNQLRLAKNLLMASGNKTLWEKHSTALTPSSIIEFTADMTAWLSAVENGTTDADYQWGKNLPPKFSIYDLDLALRQAPPSSFSLDIPAFMEVYRRRSIQKIPGLRAADGTIQPPAAKAIPLGSAYISKLIFNSNDASVQLHTERSIALSVDGKEVRQIAHVDLTRLKRYRDFTLISCGERNVEVLPVIVHNKAAHKALVPFSRKKSEAVFKPGMSVTLRLKDFSLDTDQHMTIHELNGVMKRLLEIQAQQKFLTALDTEGAAPETYSLEQKAELSKLHLTGKTRLNFSPPTTVHYTDKDEATKQGEIDSFTRYRVNFYSMSSVGIVFRSANEYVQRYYTAVDKNGAKIEKPTLADTFTKGAVFTPAPVNPRMVRSPGDHFMDTYAEHYLSTTLDASSIIRHGKELDEEEAMLIRKLRPLVMQIGCSGLLPPEYEALNPARLTGAEAVKLHNLKLTEKQMEGTYFFCNGEDGKSVAIAILPETEWYTVKAVKTDSQDEE